MATSNNISSEDQSFAEEEVAELGDEVGPMVTDRPQTLESPIMKGSFRGTRISNVLDLETGVRGGQHGQDVELRSANSMRPTTTHNRFVHHLLKIFRNILHHGGEDPVDEDKSR